jgi:hypothetical protein
LTCGYLHVAGDIHVLALNALKAPLRTLGSTTTHEESRMPGMRVQLRRIFPGDWMAGSHFTCWVAGITRRQNSRQQARPSPRTGRERGQSDVAHAPPIGVTTVPVPRHSGQAFSSSFPVPLQRRHRFSPAPLVPGFTSSGFFAFPSVMTVSLATSTGTSFRSRGCEASCKAERSVSSGMPWR